MKASGLLLAAAIAVAAPQAVAAEDAAGRYVRIETDLGGFVVELAPDEAPKTVENFLQYVEDGHYYRTIFHRVIAGFVVQGGGYSRYFNERPTRPPVPYEGDNGLSNVRGSVAMARTSDPNSATAQWYVNLTDKTGLDHVAKEIGDKPGYTVFGRDVEGMDVVDEIGSTETGDGGPFEQDVPLKPIVITGASVVEWSAASAADPAE